jgi:hypothetical protein
MGAALFCVTDFGRHHSTEIRFPLYSKPWYLSFASAADLVEVKCKNAWPIGPPRALSMGITTFSKISCPPNNLRTVSCDIPEIFRTNNTFIDGAFLASKKRGGARYALNGGAETPEGGLWMFFKHFRACS